MLIIEDNDLIRSAVEAALEDEGYAVRAEPSGSAVDDVVDRFRPDLAILDIRFPEGPDGFTIARRIRNKGSDLPILFLTAADAVDDRLTGFDAGADDYLVKPFAMAELLARTRVLLRGSGRISSDTWQVADLIVDDAARTVLRADHRIDLTPREYELLAVLVRHAGQVLSKSQLLAQVWGFDAASTNLVSVHISSLRRKLEEHGPRLIHTLRGDGFVLRG